MMLFWQQGIAKDTLTLAYVEASVLASSSGYVPLWMRSLQYGSVPYEGNGGMLKGYYGKSYQVPIKRFHKTKTYDYQYEVEAVAFAGRETDIRLIQAYVSGRAKKWELTLGRRKEIVGLGDSTLSSGFWAMSGNAIPPFKYSFGTTDYLDFAGGWLGVRLKYSDGILDNSGPTINALIHQKSLYGRIGKSTSKFNFFAGMNHNVSWGGESKVKTGGEYDYYPSGWNTYFYVVIPQKERTTIAVDPNSSFDDVQNQYGNHLGSFDAAMQYISALGDFLLYHQFAYETGRARSLVNANDGLTGLSWKNKDATWINHIVFEYFYSANQGNYISGLANLLGMEDTSKYTVENYYNNGGRGGWHYWGKGIGSPLVPINRESAVNGDYAFSRNAVKAYYLGIAGQLPNEINYQIRASYSGHAYPRYLGARITQEEMQQQAAWNIQLSKQFYNNYLGMIQLGADQGDRLQKSFGAMLTVRRIL